MRGEIPKAILILISLTIQIIIEPKSILLNDYDLWLEMTPIFNCQSHDL